MLNKPPIYVMFLLHCHYRMDEFPSVDAPIWPELKFWFLKRGLIEPKYIVGSQIFRGEHRDGKQIYGTTERGAAMVKRLCQVLTEEV